MSADKSGRRTRRILFAVFAAVCLSGAFYLLSAGADPVFISVLFGLAAFFVWLLASTKSKWERTGFADRADQVKSSKVVYGFYEDGFSGIAAGHEIRISWSKLERWGYFEEL